MSTTVEVRCQGTVKVLPIRHSICRIGSNPSFELSMPGIDDHTATLRMQNGKRHIYNRSSKPIMLNGKRVEPEQTTEWQGNQVLELADGVCIRLLHITEESKTGREARATSKVAGDNKQTSVSQSSGQKGRRLKIAGFFLTFATILFSSESETANKAADQEFSSVIRALIEAESKPNSGCYRQMRVELQNAVLRNDLKKQSVQKLRQILVSTSHASTTTVDSQVRRFVEAYL